VNLPRPINLPALALLLATLVFSGCTPAIASRSFKTFPANSRPHPAIPTPNAYQSDFLALTQFASEGFPLQERYFPAAQRTNVENEILQLLGATNCTHHTFTLAVRRYLASYSNEHAAILFNPTPQTLLGLYPFQAQYISNQLYIANLSTNYPASALDRRIVAINHHPVPEAERRLGAFFSAENEWTKRKILELPPYPYVRPHFYEFAGLTPSLTNAISLEVEDHPAISMTPRFSTNAPAWYRKFVPNPITARSKHPYDYRTFPEQNLAYLQFNACFDKIVVVEGIGMLKPWLRPFARAWLTTHFLRGVPSNLLKHGYDPDRPIFKDFLADAIRDINSQGITNLVLDLRYNGGGQMLLCYQLLYHFTDRIKDMTEFRYNPAIMSFYYPASYKKFLAAYRRQHHTDPPFGELLQLDDTMRGSFAEILDPESRYHVPPSRPVFRGRVIALANENTKSAASLLAGLLQDNQLAQIVGMPTGNNPTGPTGVTMFRLPHSGLLVTLPTEFDRRADPAKGDVLIPDHWVEPSTSDFATGNDTAFNKAVDLLLHSSSPRNAYH
jgi:hypothetical protein